MSSSATYSRLSGDEEEGGTELSLHDERHGDYSCSAGPESVPTPVAVLPPPSSTAVLTVVSPGNLPGGYEFEVSVPGEDGNTPIGTMKVYDLRISTTKPFLDAYVQSYAGLELTNFTSSALSVKVRVPPGGIEQGQKFQVQVSKQLQSMMTNTISIPVGHWRGKLWDLFSYGICHPHFWTSCLCHLLAAAQVHRRLQLNWYGRPGKESDASIAFRVLVMTLVGYFTLYVGLFLLLVVLDPNTYTPPYAPPVPPGGNYLFVLWLRDILHYVYWITTTVVLMNLRNHIREKYAIPGSDYEDCFCSCFCPCLVSSQLLRHTTDYDIYPSTCCTETGIPPTAPTIV